MNGSPLVFWEFSGTKATKKDGKYAVAKITMLFDNSQTWISLVSILSQNLSIVVGAGLCDGEGEPAYTGYAPHFSVSNRHQIFHAKLIFSLF